LVAKKTRKSWEITKGEGIFFPYNPNYQNEKAEIQQLDRLPFLNGSPDTGLA
jgi:hypothetical protein